MPGCFVKSCGSGRRKKEDDLTLHTFPRDPEHLRRWLLGLGHDAEMLDALVTKILENRTSAYRLCSRHFTRESYELRGSKWFLRKDAVPSLNLQEKRAWEHTYIKRRRTEEDPAPGTSATALVEEEQCKQVVQGSPTCPPEMSTSAPGSLPRRSEGQYWVEFLDVQSVEDVETSKLEEHRASKTPTGARPSGDCQIWTVAASAEYFPGQFHKYTQCDYRFGRKNKSIQVACRPNHRSIAVQCNIANLLPLSQGHVFQHAKTFNSRGTQTTPMEREMATGQCGVAQGPFCVSPMRKVWNLSPHLYEPLSFPLFKRRRN